MSVNYINFVSSVTVKIFPDGPTVVVLLGKMACVLLVCIGW